MRRFCLHRSSLFVGLATLIVLTLIVAPGVHDEATWPPLLDHGWPWHFMSRKVDIGDPRQIDWPITGWYGVPWLSRANWRLWEGGSDFSWQALALDVIVVAGIAGATIAIWESRRRRRASAWQFRLAEVLIAMTALAAALGWVGWQRSEDDRESEIERAFWKSDTDPSFVLSDHFAAAPDWLQRLAGADLLPIRRFHRVSGDFRSEAQYDGYEELILPHLKSLHHLRTLELGGDVRDLAAVLRTLGELPQLRTLDLEWCDELLLSKADATQLAQFRWLERLIVRSRDHVTEGAQGILQRRMPHCEIVYIFENERTPSEEATGD